MCKYPVYIIKHKRLSIATTETLQALLNQKSKGCLKKHSLSLEKARITQRGIEVGRAVNKMAQERGLTASQLSLLWIKDQPGITSPIIGPRTPAHLEDALGIMNKTLDPADRSFFDELVHPGSAVADFHNSNDWMKARIIS